MRKVAAKALYLFLCAILGMILFVMLHRAIFVLYDILVAFNYTFAFGLSSSAILIIDFLTLLLALFLGGWYGTMLGIEWYAMVYGPNSEVKPGLFHGFLPHNWRGKKGIRKQVGKISATSAAPSIAASSTTSVKVPVLETPKAAVREWSFDDLITPKPAVKKAVAKKTTVKRTRKAAEKKIAKAD